MKLTNRLFFYGSSENVYFIDGETLWDGDGWDCCTVDGCHPSDMGHWRMAQKIAPVFSEIMKKLIQ